MKNITCILTTLVLLLPLANAGGLLGGTPADCSEDDWGFGGTSIEECAWTCEGPGVISLYVDSSDEDADVTGKGACGGGDLGCGWVRETCTDSDPNSGDGTGTCSAESDEFNSSGLRVVCSDDPNDGSGTVEPTCIPRTNVCLDGGVPVLNLPDVVLPGPDVPVPPVNLECVADFLEARQLADLVETIFQPTPQAVMVPRDMLPEGIPDDVKDFCLVPNSSSSATIWMFGENVTAAVCKSGVCWTVVPICEVADNIRAWGV